MGRLTLRLGTRRAQDPDCAVPRGGTYGCEELGGHEARRPAPRTCGDRSPNPLVRLDRRVGLSSPPIVMVVMGALHHRRRTCSTRGAISVSAGQCSGSTRSYGALEAGRSAGGGVGSPVCAAGGARRQRGAKEPLGGSRGFQRRSASSRFCLGQRHKVRGPDRQKRLWSGATDD